jgi:hypothetical protein
MQSPTRLALLFALAAAWLAPLTIPARAQEDAPAPPALGQTQFKPGRDRWPVKTATDDDANEIVAKPVPTTVEALLALPRPADMPLHEANPKYQSRRAKGVETTVYKVEAEVKECRLMPDGDYRVVIQGKSGKTLVLEMPNPDPQFVAPTGRFAKQIGAARQQFEAQCRPAVPMKTVAVGRRAVITGIGFFGHTFRPDQPAEGNLVQLHPVVAIKWLPESPAKSGRDRSQAPAQKPK